MQVSCGLQYVTGAGIRYGNDAGLRRQRLEMVGEAILRVLPVFRRGFQPLIDSPPRYFFLGDQLAKGVFRSAAQCLRLESANRKRAKRLTPFSLAQESANERMIIGGDVMNGGILSAR